MSLRVTAQNTGGIRRRREYRGGERPTETASLGIVARAGMARLPAQHSAIRRLSSPVSRCPFASQLPSQAAAPFVSGDSGTRVRPSRTTAIRPLAMCRSFPVVCRGIHSWDPPGDATQGSAPGPDADGMGCSMEASMATLHWVQRPPRLEGWLAPRDYCPVSGEDRPTPIAPRPRDCKSSSNPLGR